MSFAVGFYSFTVELNNVDRNFSGRLRFKEPRHPSEPLDHLHARVLAYLHCYRPGLKLGGGLFAPDEPAISHTDVTGELLLWAEAGVPDPRKLQPALRIHERRRAGSPVEFLVYFFEESQIEQFCVQLRGSKTNWVAPVRFYLIDPTVFEKLHDLERTSPRWDATIIDDTLYLVAESVELTCFFEHIDIWSRYQRTLEMVS